MINLDFNFKALSTLEKATVILGGALVLCLLPLPYDLYTLIRLAAAVVAGCWAYVWFANGRSAAAIGACAVAVLFQPLFKIYLSRGTWNLLDIALIVLIYIFIIKPRRQ